MHRHSYVDRYLHLKFRTELRNLLKRCRIPWDVSVARLSDTELRTLSRLTWIHPKEWIYGGLGAAVVVRSLLVIIYCWTLLICWDLTHRHANLSFDVLLTVRLSIFVSVINQLDAQNFCFTINLFRASTCFEHMCSSSGGQFCASSWLITKINVNLRLSKTQLPLQYLHNAASSRTCFHYEVSHLSVLFCLSLLSQENR